MNKEWCIYIVNYCDGSIEIVKRNLTERQAMESVCFYGEKAMYGLFSNVEWRL